MKVTLRDECERERARDRESEQARERASEQERARARTRTRETERESRWGPHAGCTQAAHTSLLKTTGSLSHFASEW